MFNRYPIGCGPIHVTPQSVGPGGFRLVLGLLPVAGGSVVVKSDWMKTVRTAVGSHIPAFLHLRVPAVLHAATVIFFIGIDVLTIELAGHEGDGGGEFLISASIEVSFSLVWMLAAVLVALAAPALALTDLVTIVGHLIGGVIPVASCCSAACVLLVGVGGFDDRLKMRLGKGEVRFGG